MLKSKLAFFVLAHAAVFCTIAMAEDTFPAIQFEYAGPFDYSICSRLQGAAPIKPEMFEEFTKLMPALQDAWSAAGPELLRQTVAVAGRPFVRRELTVSLSLCDVPSMAYPLLLSVRSYLKSAAKTVRDASYFVGSAQHELIHHYLNYSFPELNSLATPLLTKYGNESIVTRVHLHLFAIQAKTYQRMHRDRELAEIQASFVHTPLERAWEIVSKIEGADAFIAELKGMGATPPIVHSVK